MFVVVLSGSLAFFAIPILVLFITVVGALNLVWDPSHRARDHEMLFQHFSKLAITIRTANDPDESSYKAWIRERINIETNEPPIFWALEADCDNEVRRAWGKDEKMVKIDRCSRWTMNLLRHEQSDFPVISDAA